MYIYIYIHVFVTDHICTIVNILYTPSQNITLRTITSFGLCTFFSSSHSKRLIESFRAVQFVRILCMYVCHICNVCSYCNVIKRNVMKCSVV